MSTPESPSWAHQHAVVVWIVAAVAGPLVAGGLTPLRPHLDDSHVPLALGLMLVVVAVSAAGLRGAGVAAAVTTGAAFDYFWTQPYDSLTIGHASDVDTVVLLIVVGAAIEQLSWWGRRQHVDAARRQSYLQTLRLATAGAGEGSARLDAVSSALVALLDADRCTFALGAGDGSTTLEPDGTVTRDGVPLPVDRDGLPTDDSLTLAVRTDLGQPAHFVITAAGHVARPTVEQRSVAALLATVSAARVGATIPS